LIYLCLHLYSQLYEISRHRLVGDINIVVEKTRVDKSQVRLAECEVGDETGTLSLRARDDQINILQEIANRNGAVVLRNCSLELYQGKFIRLAVSKWGKIHSFPDGVSSTPTPPSTMNDSLHLSIVDLNEVAGDDWNESLLTPNSTDRNAQRDSPGSGATDNFTGRDKHNRHSPRQRPSRHGSGGHGHQSYSKDKRHNRNKKTSSGGGGYNTNIVHMVPGMPSLPLYAAPHYNYARFDQHAMQNMYHQHPNQHQQQQQQVHQEDYSYMSYQEYTMRMQMEAMRLSYQQQAPQHQHQHRAGRHIYHPISPQGSQAHNHNPNAFTDSHGHQTQFPVPSHQSAPSNDFSQTSQSPVAAMATTPIAPSPVSGAASSPYTATMAHAEAWSIQQEAESPMMNPHAAVFNSAHANMPSLTLPDNHYYAQNASYSLTPYMQVGQSQGQVPGHSMTSTEAYPTPGPYEPVLEVFVGSICMCLVESATSYMYVAVGDSFVIGIPSKNKQANDH